MAYAEIVFAGMITFITPASGPVAAVALNAPEPVVASTGKTIPAHVAWLRFDLDDLEVQSPVQPDTIIDFNGRRHGVVFLRGEEIRIASASAETDLTLIDGIPADAELPTLQSREFLHWVPRLRDILGREHAIDPSYLDRVSMRFHLDRGRLATSLVQPVAWEFRPSVSTPMRRAMAQEVSLRIALREPLTLELQRFDSAESRLLKFVRADARVTFGNTPLANIAGAAPHDHDAHVDHHFELYYRILADPPRILPLPHRVAAPVERGRWRVASHSGSGINCGPDRVP